MFKIVAAILLASFSLVYAEQKPFQLTWPRSYDAPGAELTVHQPQVDDWQSYSKLSAKSAIVVSLNGVPEPVYGALYFTVDTSVNMQKRLVAMQNLKLTKIFFPNSNKSVTDQAEKATREALAERKSIVVALSRITALVEDTKDLQKNVDVNYAPPQIHYSSEPAILINTLGKPSFKKLENSGLDFCANTNWDLISDPDTKDYYLLYFNSWLKTKNLQKGPWIAADKLPEKFRKIPDDGNWKEVINKPTVPVKKIPKVIFSEKPAELILTEGEEKLVPISNTKLSYVENSESDLFYSKTTRKYYFLITGRWFQADTLAKEWESAKDKLPEDFKKIPDGSPKDHVKAAIPGTDEAKSAVLMASLPRRATVQRDTKLTVSYEGEPEFALIKGTNIEFALNTGYDVFKVGGKYYCCYKAVWFTAASPKGTWIAATEIPQEIYAIPSDHPKHHVTYVYITSHTAEVVYVYSTSGYSGCYVSDGVVVYGSGYWHWHYPPHWYYYHCYSWYYSYGCCIRVDYYKGDYYRGAHYYGPYGGVGGWTAYNPDTGTYQRGGFAYGPYGAVKFQRAYNPETGWRAAGYQAATPYQSWGKGVVSNGDDWLKAGYKHDYDRGTALGYKGSDDQKGLIIKDKDGNKGAIVRDKDGDLYVGKNGQVYRKTSDGWEKRGEDGKWDQLPQTRPSAQLSDQQKKDLLQNDKLRQLKEAQQRDVQTQDRMRKLQEAEARKHEALNNDRLRQLQQQRQRLEQQRRVQDNLRRQSIMRQRSIQRSAHPSIRMRRR